MNEEEKKKDDSLFGKMDTFDILFAGGVIAMIAYRLIDGEQEFAIKDALLAGIAAPIVGLAGFAIAAGLCYLYDSACDFFCDWFKGGQKIIKTVIMVLILVAFYWAVNH